MVKNKDNMKNFKLYFDGSCEPINPGGDIGVGYYVVNGDGELMGSLSKKFSRSEFKNGTSNNIAEYLALKLGLAYCIEIGIKNLDVFGDSMLVIKQMSGEWKIKKGLYVEYANASSELNSQFDSINYFWVSRDENNLADDLSKANHETIATYK